MKNTGIQLTNDCELAISVQRDTGGLIISGILVGNTLYQNQYLILKAQKGEIKEFPTLGCGIMQVNKLTIGESGMSLEADYK